MQLEEEALSGVVERRPEVLALSRLPLRGRTNVVGDQIDADNKNQV